VTDEEWNSFDRCWVFLEPALNKGLPTHTKEQVRSEVDGDLAQLWPLPNAAVLTKVITYPSGLKVLRVWLLGGRLKEIAKFLPFLIDWARSIGCQKINSCSPDREWGAFYKRLARNLGSESRYLSTEWVGDL
jgi:hypothetical protein